MRKAVIIGCLLIVVFVRVESTADEIRKVTAADMPRIPATEAVDAIRSFRLADGFSVELVAAEPLVSDPVAACFDEFNRMFVAEMHGYPFSQEPTRLNPDGGGLPDAGIIRVLEDTDGDGKMDRSVVFADGISWPTSVCCYNGGVFVIAPEHLYYLKDTDGDLKADIREVVVSGFARDNVQAVTNGLLWGLDNRIYFAGGRNPRRLKLRGKPLKLPGGNDLRFDPRTETFEAVAGGQQFGHTKDDWGTRFVCSNSDHIRQAVYPQSYFARNPAFVPPEFTRSIAKDGASARVFRTSPPEPWRIVRQKWRAAEKGYRLQINSDGGWEFLPMDASRKAGVVPTEYPVGYFTSASGITIYRGNAYPDRYAGNAFVGDVGGNLVHRKVVDSSGVVYAAEPADVDIELLASADNWFRPVNFVNAPDGTLYVLDMYRETIEHPYSIPEEIKAFLDLTSGRDRGRIYRLVSPEMRRIKPKKIGELSSAHLVQELASTNGWNRDTAQRLLWERQDMTVVPGLRELAKTETLPQARLHALWTLQAMRAITDDVLLEALQDKHPRVRAHAVRLAETRLTESAEILKSLCSLGDDASEHVRFQVAFSLGQSESESAVQTIANMATDPVNGPEIQAALMSSVAGTADSVAMSLLRDDRSERRTAADPALNRIAVMIGTSNDPLPARRVLAEILKTGVSFERKSLVLRSLGEGLDRRGSSLADLLTADTANQSLTEGVDKLFAQVRSVADDSDEKTEDRVAAIRLLAFDNSDRVLDLLSKFLGPQTAKPMQSAAVEALSAHPTQQVSPLLVSAWRSLSPEIRRDAIDLMVSTNVGVQHLLDAVESKTVKSSDIERDRKQILMRHRDPTIRSRSASLLGANVVSNRTQVVADHQHVLSLERDVERGRNVFQKTCSGCHRVGNVGHQVAPDLVSVKNKSEADLLISILDPNREAQPNFNIYTVVTNQGRTYNGIVVNESAGSITLRRAEAKQDIILRDNIDEMIATGLSLMPEGLEKDLSAQQLADLIAFVKSL